MWITRDGEYMQFPDDEWLSSSLPGKGWVPSDPPLAPPPPMPPSPSDLAVQLIDAQLRLDCAMKLLSENPNIQAMTDQVSKNQALVSQLIAALQPTK